MLVDFELIKRAQAHDSAAFNEVVLAYRKRILGTITRLIARSEDVEEIRQSIQIAAPDMPVQLVRLMALDKIQNSFTEILG